MEQRTELEIQDHFLMGFVNYALDFFDDEENKKDFEAWREARKIEKCGKLPERSIGA